MYFITDKHKKIIIKYGKKGPYFDDSKRKESNVGHTTFQHLCV